MDTTIYIDHSPESILNAAKTFMSYYTGLTGIELMMCGIDNLPEYQIEEYKKCGIIISGTNTFRNHRYTSPKESQFASRIDRTYESFLSFIRLRCNCIDGCSVPASALLNEFSTVLGRHINSNKEFPALMNKLMSMEEYSGIEKKSTGKGIVYTGITLKSRSLEEKHGKKKPAVQPIVSININRSHADIKIPIFEGSISRGLKTDVSENN